MKAQFLSYVGTCVLYCLSEVRAVYILLIVPHSDGAQSDVGWCDVDGEVLHSGEDASHSAGVAVA